MRAGAVLIVIRRAFHRIFFIQNWRCTAISESLVNGQIRFREVRLIGTEGEQLGVMPSQEALQKAEGLTVIDAGDILSDPESVRKVRTADAVVLVERKNVSSMADIERETELLKTMGVKLEGFILA